MSADAFEPLVAADTPLAGMNLIEANAGTGKTWTITALYLRLLVEAQRSVDSILVVTFTDAATGELRDRIRARIAAARDAYVRGDPGDDALLQALFGRTDRAQALLRLTAAVTDFDQAPVYTIHGFCQRVLSDHAFESRMPFAAEIVPDETALLTEVVEDYWRNELARATPLYARFLAASKVEPDALRKLVSGHIGKPYVEIRAAQEPGDVAGLEDAFDSACANARAIWASERGAIGYLLEHNDSLHAGRYRKASIPAWIEQMDACLAGAVRPDLCASFEKFTARALATATNRGKATPQHRFFESCDEVTAARDALQSAYDARLRALAARLIAHAKAELAALKARRHLRSYDDLLTQVRDALAGERGPKLAERLRERYSAALIDEFQDTDPVQYGIFRALYGGTSLPVFLVGDPKQSIYGFRGADVYAYLKARGEAAHRHTLDVNWRSAPPLLEAVNALFERSPAPFLIGDIPFRASQPAPGDRGRLVVANEVVVPFEIWHLESDDGDEIGKTDAAERAIAATAARIAELLAQGSRDEAEIVMREDGNDTRRRLCGGDIAVLVRTHRHARMVRDALNALGVAAVQRGAENVYSTREAEELERVLLAIAEPGREALIAAALTTEMLGCSGEALYALRGDENAWGRTVEAFRDAHRDWRERGLIRMLRRLFETYEVVPRLLGYSDGERRVTNLLQLTELLHCEAGALHGSAAVAWLATKRREASASAEAELLRLESDENLVKILTIHVAKGLEFPVVFCPCLWDGTLWAEKDALVRFHDPDLGYAPVLDTGSEAIDAARAHARREEMAENLRLLYVALTRARHHCAMVWGPIAQAGSSAPAWLLHGPKDEASVAALAAFAGGTLALTPGGIKADLETLERAAGGAIRVRPLPSAPGVPLPIPGAHADPLRARPFEGVLRDTRRMTSFTALAHGRTVEAPDYDAADRAPLSESVSGRDIFAFPRGARAGKCLHAIFERIDFTRSSRADIEPVVVKALDDHGFDAEWARAVIDMVRATLDTPLDATGMRLNTVTRRRRLDELEFYYPIDALADSGLRARLQAYGFPEEISARIGELEFSTARGYMRGFIDLVYEHDGRYYLADYKSNWLGASVSAYGQSALAKAMGREAYYLQYLIYCVALHRYLATRVRDYRYASHFGGVRYLFVRGMSARSGHEYGVYADCPSEALITSLDEYLRKGTA